jgi:uncharacterized membrane protein
VDVRPKVSVEKTQMETVLNAASILLLFLTYFYLLYIWNDLPEKVPVHFDFSGKADRWGGKGSILTLPIIETILFVMLWILSKFPQLYNYPVKITEENAQSLYLEARRLIVVLNFEIVLFFSIGSWETAQTASQKATLGMWYIPLLLITIFGSLTVSIIRMIRMK